MTWGEILRLYNSACGESPSANTERWLHINDSYRKVVANLDLDELEEDVSPVSTTTGVDWVTLPANLFHILSVHNTTLGYPVQPEPSGMRGRERYYQSGTGMPESGQPRYYARAGGRIYLRDTPDGVYALNVRFKLQPALISDSDLASSPLTPSQWDLAIIAGAAASFMRIHPDADATYAEQGPRSALLDSVMQETMQATPEPKAKELFDQRGRMYIPINLRR